MARPGARSDRNNVRRALDWFLSFLGTEEWTARKAAIDEYLQETSPIYPSRSVAEMHPPVSTALDTIHWYMYLAENFLTSDAKYEPTQGARILLQPLRTKQPHRRSGPTVTVTLTPLSVPVAPPSR